jgi:hypothetical protein
MGYGTIIHTFTGGLVKPGIDSVNSWQGIVELISRGIVVVS